MTDVKTQKSHSSSSVKSSTTTKSSIPSFSNTSSDQDDAAFDTKHEVKRVRGNTVNNNVNNSNSSNSNNNSNNNSSSIPAVWETTFLKKEAIPIVFKFYELLIRKESVKQTIFRKILNLVIVFLEEGSITSDATNIISSDQLLKTIFLGVLEIFQSALTHKTKDTVIANDLNKMSIPALFSSDIVQAFGKKREVFEEKTLIDQISLPNIVDLQWRVDVTVSTTSLSRVFKPTVIMQITLSDDTIKTFECSVEKFHQLRYNVAKVLKNMHDLEQHPILKRDD